MTITNIQILQDFIENPKPKVSFEFFPPKTEEMEGTLWDSITHLKALDPTFVSVTYGAGGSTRERTRSTLAKILKETDLKPAAHLTCVCHTREEIQAIAKDYWELGVKHIVALRGDVPDLNGGKYVPDPEGYAYADDLVKGLKDIADFEISVAAYPETHPDAASPEADIDHLKRKVDAGADRAITQYFFDTNKYFEFLNKVEQQQINVPIVPGIVPIHNYSQLVRFSKMCGATVPDWITKLLKDVDEDPETHQLVSAVIAAEQCRQLMEGGVDQVHFYTLNRWQLTASVCHLLGFRKHETMK